VARAPAALIATPATIPRLAPHLASSSPPTRLPEAIASDSRPSASPVVPTLMPSSPRTTGTTGASSDSLVVTER
jgi:hypothetical protein